MNDHTNRSTKMNLMNEDLARAQMSARLGEAHEHATRAPARDGPPAHPPGRAGRAAGASRPRPLALRPEPPRPPRLVAVGDIRSRTVSTPAPSTTTGLRQRSAAGARRSLVAHGRPATSAARRRPATTLPLTWTTAVENGRRRVFCDGCSREHLRAIEGKLDSEWW